MKKISKTEGYRIAAYVRVSTEEQAANPEGSVKNQEQRIKEYVRHRHMEAPFGKLVAVFCDPGISAKNMNRPALQRLLQQVKVGAVNLIIVTDLSRLTRSTKDFALLWDFLRDHGCKFQSLRESFDSTTAAGEMIMFTLANFAQFERKQTGERISHSFLARAKRGLYNGGSVPLGYRIDGTKAGHLCIVEEEAEIIRLVFKTYLQEQTLAQTAKRLNEMKVKFPRTHRGSGTPRGEIFRMSMVHGILKQKAYIGMRVYKIGETTEETKAAWEPIIDQTTFDRVQALLAKNKSTKKPMHPRRHPFLLSGLCFCEKCGDRMSGKTAHGNGGKFAYYEHGWQTKANANLVKNAFHCEPARVQANRIEEVVWREVKAFLTDPKMAKALLAEAHKAWEKAQSESPEKKLKKKISATQSQIEALAERIGKLPKDFDATPLLNELSNLQALKSELEIEISSIPPKQEQPLSFTEFRSFQIQLASVIDLATEPETKAQIISRVVQRVNVFETGIEIVFHAGKTHYSADIETQTFPNSSSRPSGHAQIQNTPAEKSAGALFFSQNHESLNVVGSNTLTSGAGDGTQTHGLRLGNPF